MNELEFIKQLETKGITLTPQQVNQFKQYFKILVEWNEKMNLTAITDEEAVYLKHFYDALTIAFDYAKDHRQKCDIVMARAVARLNILDELCLPLVKVGGYFLALKGLKATEELEEAGKGIVLLGGQVEKSIDFTLTNDNHRSNIIIKKVRDTPAKYPRMFGKIKKQPL